MDHGTVPQSLQRNVIQVHPSQTESTMIRSATLPMFGASFMTTMIMPWQVQPLRYQSTGLSLYLFDVSI
jgi:hypothetical protein